MNKRVREETYIRIMHDLGKEPVELSFFQKLRQSFVIFISNNMLSLIVCWGLIIAILVPLSIFMTSKNSVAENFTVSEHRLEDGIFTIRFEGGDPDSLASYMESDSGDKLYPISYSKENRSLSFECSERQYNIFVYSKKGSVIQMVILLD